ncbi:MAG TPA: hypothetical protein VD731_05915 [Nitrosopumilaceae archaeon]|nr:hypothetical protein [Nitrosopumilaceae archaeon]
MDSFIIDDVNALLNLKKGDSGRLVQIKEICEANGIVALADRKYVERLASQYLKKVEIKKPKNPNKPKLFPIDESSLAQPLEADSVKVKNELLKKPQFDYELENKKNQVKTFDLGSNNKIIIGIGAIVLAIILVTTISIEYNVIQFPGNTNVDTVSSEFSLETDLLSYEPTDIISISGRIPSVSSGLVKLSITNPNNKLVWTENLNLKNDGSFSTLLIAGGAGWENSGKFNLNAEHEKISKQISFDYIAK